MSTQVIMPQMGEGVMEGAIARWLKQVGDTVARYDPILEVETDKVTTEITADADGVLLQILAPEGATVPVGAVLALIGQPDEDKAPPTPTAQPAPAAEKQAAAPGPTSNGGQPSYTRQSAVGRISPVVARIAAEHNVDLTQITGTGRDNRITKQDILAYVESMSVAQSVAAPVVAPSPAVAPPPPAAPATPAPKPAPPAPTPQAGEVVPLTNIRRAIAEHMVLSKRTSPHVTTVFEVDFSAVSAHRQTHKEAYVRDGVNLTFTPYIVMAIVSALKAHPMVNSVWTDEGILLRREINIGMATAIPTGLIVPVIKQADSYNLLGMARAVNDLSERARTNKLRPDDVRDGTFSLTNHGVSGSLFATPIINQPQCGILGVGMIQKRVVVVEDMIAIRPMAYVSFTFDHRILDGASADYFVAAVKEKLETWE